MTSAPTRHPNRGTVRIALIAGAVATALAGAIFLPGAAFAAPGDPAFTLSADLRYAVDGDQTLTTEEAGAQFTVRASWAGGSADLVLRGDGTVVDGPADLPVGTEVRLELIDYPATIEGAEIPGSTGVHTLFWLDAAISNPDWSADGTPLESATFTVSEDTLNVTGAMLYRMLSGGAGGSGGDCVPAPIRVKLVKTGPDGTSLAGASWALAETSPSASVLGSSYDSENAPYAPALYDPATLPSSWASLADVSKLEASSPTGADGRAEVVIQHWSGEVEGSPGATSIWQGLTTANESAFATLTETSTPVGYLAGEDITLHMAGSLPGDVCSGVLKPAEMRVWSTGGQAEVVEQGWAGDTYEVTLEVTNQPLPTVEPETDPVIEPESNPEPGPVPSAGVATPPGPVMPTPSATPVGSNATPQPVFPRVAE